LFWVFEIPDDVSAERPEKRSAAREKARPPRVKYFSRNRAKGKHSDVTEWVAEWPRAAAFRAY